MYEAIFKSKNDFCKPFSEPTIYIFIRDPVRISTSQHIKYIVTLYKSFVKNVIRYLFFIIVGRQYDCVIHTTTPFLLYN